MLKKLIQFFSSTSEESGKMNEAKVSRQKEDYETRDQIINQLEKLANEKEHISLFRLPQSIEDAKITSWLVNEGEWISAGSLLCEIETKKATFELESEIDGYIYFRQIENTFIDIDTPLCAFSSTKLTMDQES
ncbi:lipoyl domain-containing protein [Sediminitomix flava]|uniref:Biotin-dependent enzyme n=1 Tax=Sediminitomix flava TaxID=379075 RepID=A0A315ZDE6_SEDFL|nr:lipoyl domain-containing protein [Sediminitomix flava]PWJ43143.1 biotin-dependent enzyme [Sediminitomix flava]